MRILHTSDWHLGRQFHRTSLLDVQAEAMDRIVELVRDRGIDVVLIAGDLYDRAIPPVDAVELFDTTLLRIRDAGAVVVAIGGNHDSPARVGYGDRLLERTGVTVRGSVTRAGEPVELAGSSGATPVVIYPVPYLDPTTVAQLVRSTAVDTPGPEAVAPTARSRFTHQHAMDWALDRVRADRASRAAAGSPARSVVVAHTFVAGATTSESERDITVGAIEVVDASCFANIDYVALGHLHADQDWFEGRVAYSGTPLPYSFSEEHHTKSVRVVDLADDGSLAVEVVPLGVGRPLRTVTGELDHLLGDPSLVGAEHAWVRAVLTDRDLPLQAMARLQARFPFAVELRHQPAAGIAESAGQGPTRHDIDRLDPLELALRFLHDQRGEPADELERELLGDAIAAVSTGGSR